ncbi:MAG: hypothetical protein AAF585_05540 [Verrucomicrobiota bacterium]
MNKMNRVWISAAAGAFVSLLVFGNVIAQAPAKAGPYGEPKFSNPLFDGAGLALGLTDRTTLINALVATAHLKHDNTPLSAMALAYANSIEPGQWSVVETNFFLKQQLEIPREKVSRGDPTALKGLIAAVKAGDSTSNSVATEYLEDIVSVIENGITSASTIHIRWEPHLSKPGEDSPAASAPVDLSLPVQSFEKSQATMAGVYYGDVDLRISDDLSMIEKRWMVQKAMRPMILEAKVSSAGGGPTSIELADDTMPPELASAMKEMVKMFSLRKLTIPTGNRIEISFEEGYSGADGPTAVLACAIMVDALVTGSKLDPSFAAIGDLNADGTIQKVYGLDVRLRTAKDSQVEILAVPDVKGARLGDLVLNNEGDLLLKTQVFTVKDFDEAKKIAVAPESRDPQLQEAIKTFAEVQKALNRPNPMSYLRNPQVRERLQKTLQLAPNHASAKLLLLKGANRNPQKLTLVGSLNEINHAAVFLQDGKSPKYGDFRTAIAGVGRKRDLLDQRCLEWFSAIANYNTLANQGGSSLSGTQRDEHRQRVEHAQKRIDLEYQKLMSNPEIREVLMAN